MEPVLYQAYLLRLWCDSPNGPWRASLEDPHTGARHHFATVDQLRQHLRELVAERDAGDTTTSREPGKPHF